MSTKAAAALVGLLVIPFCICFLPISGLAQQARPRDITVEDSIESVIVKTHAQLGTARQSPAWFSPDGKRFIVVLKKGDVSKNVNVTSLALYRGSTAMHSPKPDIVITFSSASELNAIRDLKWVDNVRIAFLGAKQGMSPQVYLLNVKTRRVDQLTNESRVITRFDLSETGSVLLYAVQQSLTRGMDANQQRNGFVLISTVDQRLALLARRDYAHQDFREQIYRKVGNRAAEPICRMDIPPVGGDALRLSPDGRYGLVLKNLLGSDLKRKWLDYDFAADPHFRTFFDPSVAANNTPFMQYQLIDITSGTIRPLIDAPFFLHGRSPSVAWKPSGRTVLVEDQYVPLDGVDPKTLEKRKATRYDVEVDVPNGELRILPLGEIKAKDVQVLPIDVTLDQDANTPPRIEVTDRKTSKRMVLLDPNPQFGNLRFGRVEILEWKVGDRYTVAGGLYLPPDFVNGKQYPLVIQTHGFRPEIFTMDGKLDWNSGFAARELAARGIMVLQMYYFPNEKEAERIEHDKRFGNNSTQIWKQFETRAYEGAIDALDERKMIDRDRIGIMGFSRTVSYVGYALTHSAYHFAAALAVDGIDASYFSYIAYAGPDFFNSDAELLNGGGPPWGTTLSDWIRESPGFNLDKITTPVRLEAHDNLLSADPGGGVMSLWEWFIGLLRLGKPVEYIVLPNASHMVATPSDRIVSQQGAVDWFCFWLQGAERRLPPDAQQYVRWRRYRHLIASQGTESRTIGAAHR